MSRMKTNIKDIPETSLIPRLYNPDLGETCNHDNVDG